MSDDAGGEYGRSWVCVWRRSFSFLRLRLENGAIPPATLYRSLVRHLHTLALFTYTDYKTIILPVSVFSSVAAPVHSFSRFLEGSAWIALHLLQCNVSNQYKSAAEDAINKPWRPIPSGRITQRQAYYLRWFLFTLSLGVSTVYGPGAVLASLVLTVTMVAYDEVGLAGHCVGKNLCTASGYCAFEVGATIIMGQSTVLDHIALKSLVLSVVIIITTVQMQDFPDICGDTALNRRTLPIAFPEASRSGTGALIVFWSIGLAHTWHIGPGTGTIILLPALWMAWRTWALRTVEEDKLTYKIYNMWLFAVHVLPLFARVKQINW